MRGKSVSMSMVSGIAWRSQNKKSPKPQGRAIFGKSGYS